MILSFVSSALVGTLCSRGLSPMNAYSWLHPGWGSTHTAAQQSWLEGSLWHHEWQPSQPPTAGEQSAPPLHPRSMAVGFLAPKAGSLNMNNLWSLGETTVGNRPTLVMILHWVYFTELFRKIKNLKEIKYFFTSTKNKRQPWPNGLCILQCPNLYHLIGAPAGKCHYKSCFHEIATRITENWPKPSF